MYAMLPWQYLFSIPGYHEDFQNKPYMVRLDPVLVRVNSNNRRFAFLDTFYKYLVSQFDQFIKIA